MFAKINDKTLNIIGQKKENLQSSLSSKMFNLNIQVSPGKIDYFLEEMNRYNNSKVVRAGIFGEAYDYMIEYFDPIKVALRRNMGMLEKMNIMLKGDPGTGKTHLACTIAKEIVKKNNGIGVVINDIESLDFGTVIDNLRINDSEDRLIVMVIDELEKNPRWVLNSSKFLGFLDGAESRENVIIISTVNSIDELPEYLTNRPGRFEKIYEFEFQTEEVLRLLTIGIIPEKYKENEELITKIVKDAISLEINTIDHLRFFILDKLFCLEKGKPHILKTETYSVNIEVKDNEDTDGEAVDFLELASEEVVKELNKNCIPDKNPGVIGFKSSI